ncbi:MAG: DNA replication/repair protein RecF [Heliobacteriaceae bacterium]|jgi:DNA replication and repair protein RecF|nr:DNA replication/repair protein RecF [Heliobacteriaceae bacterium]
MKLINLKLKNYRNCRDLGLNLDARKVLIIGKNAQGKTNILESIYFMSALKSPRASGNLELINFDAHKTEISLELIKSDTSVELDFTYDREKTRELKINKVKSRPKDFKSVLKTVLFSTSDLLLLRGNPSDRRAWLDRAISQVYPAYDDRLGKYDKIRIQKNNFLKDGGSDDALLEVLNEQLAITGSNIIYLRKKFLDEIEKIASEKHRIISETEELSIDYASLPGQDVDEIAAAFRQALEERKPEELRRGQACVGPHRDDVIFYINGKEAVKFASQGQQRTIVLALKLSELDIITEKTGDEPVLLLDDVLAELDDIRQNYLLKSINNNTQTIITSVDAILFEKEFLQDVLVYKVEKGDIR